MRPHGWVVSVAVSGTDEQRKALEEALTANHRVVRSDPVTFTYRPTPPSGPPPERTDEPKRAESARDGTVTEA
jgi:hypothetical protein